MSINFCNTDVPSLALLEHLCSISAPPGNEEFMEEAILNIVTPYGYHTIHDIMGNIITKVPGKNHDKKILLAAHMDEVGFMITSIEDNGYLRFDVVGIDPRVLCGKSIIINGYNGKVSGVILSKPIYLLNESEKTTATPIENMYIDIGATSKNDAQKYVQIGDCGSFAPDFRLFGSHDSKIVSKAIDDRIGCAVLCEILRAFSSKEEPPPYDTYFAFTVREELVISGAKCVSYAIQPDYALILESTAVSDIFATAPEKRVGTQGLGGILSIIDHLTVYDYEWVRKLKNFADQKEIPVQIKQYVSGGNDAGIIQKAGIGVKVAALSAPCRYLHTESNVISKEDYHSIYQLTKAIIENAEDWIYA